MCIPKIVVCFVVRSELCDLVLKPSNEGHEEHQENTTSTMCIPEIVVFSYVCFFYKNSSLRDYAMNE